MNGDVNHDDHDDPPCALINALSGWWRWEELNLRHGAYETPALPLSYTADPRKVDQLQDEILPQTPRSCPKTYPNRAYSRPPACPQPPRDVRGVHGVSDGSGLPSHPTGSEITHTTLRRPGKTRAARD